MVKPNRIEHLDGNGAALNEIANPSFSQGCLQRPA